MGRPDPGPLDSQTFSTWLDENATTPGGRFNVELVAQSAFAAEPRDVSLLWAAYYIAGAGNAKNTPTVERLVGVTDGAQEMRFVGGSQLVSIKAAASLGKRVVLEAPVRRIEQSIGRVDVVTDRGTFRGKSVIVAIAPTLAGRIDYQPILPWGRDGLTQRVPQGSVIKCEAVYDKPFWRREGLAGYTNADTPPIALTYDNSPPSGTPGVLLGFICGRNARTYGAVSPAARRKAVIANFVSYYGPQAAKPKQFIEKSWATEEWSRGCYEGLMAPGVMLDYGRYLREPVGRIHWAGEATADHWHGYMDGAVRSGERAAAEVG